MLSWVKTCPEKAGPRGSIEQCCVGKQSSLSAALQTMGFYCVRCFHCILKASADARQHGPAIPAPHWIWKQVSIHGRLALTPRELLSFRSRENKGRGLKQDAWLMQCAPSLPAVHLSNHRPACWVALRHHCEKLTVKGVMRASWECRDKNHLYREVSSSCPVLQNSP